MSANGSRDMEVTITPNTNPIFELANTIRNAVGNCVQRVFTPQMTQSKPEKPRPKAMVLLNAHGNYPYELFEDRGRSRSDKELKYQDYTIKNKIPTMLDPSDALHNDAISTLFNNIFYTSSVPAPYCGMMVAQTTDEDGKIIKESSREAEIEIVKSFVPRLQTSSSNEPINIQSVFTDMRHALRANANTMYKTSNEKIKEESPDIKDFLTYINGLIISNDLYKSYPLCSTNFDKTYQFYPNEDEIPDFVPHYGFHIWINGNYYNLFDQTDYNSILLNVIYIMPDENPKKGFSIHMLNNVIKKGMINRTPTLKLSEISLFLWSLDLTDIIISDSACSIVLDMQGDDIVTNDNFKNTIGRLYTELFPQPEDSQPIDYESDIDYRVTPKLGRKPKTKKLPKTKQELRDYREETMQKIRHAKEMRKNKGEQELLGGKSTKMTKMKKTTKVTRGKRRNKKQKKKTRKEANKKRKKTKRKQT
jgi:hypothetical protein